MNYGYSAKTNTFYVLEDQEAYETNNNWPDDVKPVSVEYWEKYREQSPAGKIRGADTDGLPCWIDAPPLSQQEQVNEASRKKSLLIVQASNAIAPLQDAVELGMATEKEKTQLVAWKTCRVLANRIRPEEAPNIDWPPAPDA
ncbi:tail fiber assembly protein [Serratia entomophila]|uniref:Tail fiber assembly protein n=1 Tax=Serratia entomophila TaxID=42906 RepID=A0ABY5CQJ7_9GAMM|nr:tail fiber assembly protein [Serratia entomophila]USV00391.1 tail fiber assembly protein [Serratia entomophila]CAI1613076.1 Caudovirales tail fibre assembly protein [Serratia entomophila]